MRNYFALLLLLCFAGSPHALIAKEPLPPELRFPPEYILPPFFMQVPDMLESAIGGVVSISAVKPAEEADTAQAPHTPPDKLPLEELSENDPNNARKKPMDSRGQEARIIGSGFVTEESGIIVTTNGLVDGATDFQVSLRDGTKLSAKILSQDEKADIALLKVDTKRPLKALKLGDSSKLRLGQTIHIIGNPFGLDGTVRSGGIAALDRSIGAAPYDSFIQVDAAINKGDSGAPIFNIRGEVVGIIASIFSPTGISAGVSFAIPSNLATQVIAQLKEFGEPRRGWLGIRIQSITDELASSLGMEKTSGALVTGVTHKGPAELAGMKSGDVIISFGDRVVADPRALSLLVATTKIGETIDVEVLRDGKKQTLQIAVMAQP